MIRSVLIAVLFALPLAAQEPCLPPAAEAKPDKDLAKTIIALARRNIELYQKSQSEPKDAKLKEAMAALRRESETRLCTLIRKNGIPSTAAIGGDAAASFFYLLKTLPTLKVQTGIVPALTTAVEQGRIDARLYAEYLDLVRRRAGLPQLFGTLYRIRDEALILFPLVDEEQAEAARAKYRLPPLAEDIGAFERYHRMPLIREPAAEEAIGSAADGNGGAATASTTGDDDVIKVDSRLVNINVSVFAGDLRSSPKEVFKPEDFKIFDNGVEMKPAFFGEARMPFDLLLLIDLSGSTTFSRDLMIRSTARFIEAARPGDRIGIRAFSTRSAEISPLTADKVELIRSLAFLEGQGGSEIWRAALGAIRYMDDRAEKGRRRAIVLISDGIDNQMMESFRDPVLYADLVDALRRSETIINVVRVGMPGTWTLYDDHARRAMARLASESGGVSYETDSLKGLESMYERVLGDLARVYSIAYEPPDSARDGKWRMVSVTMPNHPKLITRTRTGYFIK